MNTRFITYLALSLLGSLSACYEDNSTMGGADVPEIAIAPMTAQPAENIISYTGTHLKIQPKITTGYTDNQLEYAWYIYETEAPAQEGGFKKTKISDTRDLDYEVSLPSGNYTVVLEVKSKEDGYARTQTLPIQVSTAFSKGFYVLKENSDGNTDIDLDNDGVLSTDILRKNLGSAMNGKPRNISVVYTGEFIDPQTNKPAQGNLLHIFTENNDYKAFEAETLTEILNKQTLFYSADMSGETPYICFRAPMHTVYFSNTGIRTAATAQFGSSKHNTGRLGEPVDKHGTSRFILAINSAQDMAYWSNEEHKLRDINWNFEPSTALTTMDGSTYPNDLECISAGLNTIGDIWSPTITAYFLCEQPSTKTRYLLLLDGVFSFNGIQIQRIIKLDPSLHLAKSQHIAINRQTATYIYSIDGNKLYAYSWLTRDEREFPLPGIPAGEEITYLSNQCFHLPAEYGYDTKSNFDNLIVGTQTGNTYKLYFYDAGKNMNGGRPISAPDRVITGTGKVKAVRFMSPVKLGGMEHMLPPVYPMTD